MDPIRSVKVLNTPRSIRGETLANAQRTLQDLRQWGYFFDGARELYQDHTFWINLGGWHSIWCMVFDHLARKILTLFFSQQEEDISCGADDVPQWMSWSYEKLYRELIDYFMSHSHPSNRDSIERAVYADQVTPLLEIIEVNSLIHAHIAQINLPDHPPIITSKALCNGQQAINKLRRWKVHFDQFAALNYPRKVGNGSWQLVWEFVFDRLAQSTLDIWFRSIEEENGLGYWKTWTSEQLWQHFITVMYRLNLVEQDKLRVQSITCLTGWDGMGCEAIWQVVVRMLSFLEFGAVEQSGVEERKVQEWVKINLLGEYNDYTQSRIIPSTAQHALGRRVLAYHPQAWESLLFYLLREGYVPVRLVKTVMAVGVIVAPAPSVPTQKKDKINHARRKHSAKVCRHKR